MFRLFPVVLALAMVAPASLFAAGERSLEAQMADLATDVGTILKDQGIGKVTIKISGPTVLPSSGPALLTEILGTELKKHDVAVSKLGASVGISGTMRIEELKDEEGTVRAISVMVQLLIVDSQDKPILNLDSQKMKLSGTDAARLLGIPFDAGSNTGGSVAPNASIVQGLKDPQQSIGSVIRAKSDSPFGIQVLVNGQPREATLDGGLALAELKDSDEFVVKLINDADFEVAVKLTLDGIDSFWFTKERAMLWIVPPRSTFTVPGWQVNEGNAVEFKIVPFEKSVAAEIGQSSENIGVIAASFARAYLENEPFDKFDAYQHAQPKSLENRKGVGKGDPFEHKVITVKRKIGYMRANVPVRYEKPKQ